MKRLVLLAGVLFLLVGCEDSPTAPSGRPSDVSGTYRGQLTLTIEDAPGHGPMRSSYPMTATVTQSGSTVTLSATVTYPGEPPSTLWDDVQGTIDSSGEFHGPAPTDYIDSECGRITYGRRRIVFRGDTLTYRLTARTRRCGTFEFEATLRRG